MIIHISGPSGSGKTTLGNKLKKRFGKQIVVKDLDDLRAEFVKKHYGGYDKIWGVGTGVEALGKKKFKWDKNAYQKWIYDFINKQKKTIIFVGLNHMPWWNKKLYYDLKSDYNFYINISDDKIWEQKCLRFINDEFSIHRNVSAVGDAGGIKNVLKDIKKNEKKTISDLQKGLKFECGYNEMKKQNTIWNKDYKKQGYKFMTNDKIYKELLFLKDIRMLKPCAQDILLNKLI